ncbi:MAG TPA: glycosyltransferase family 2 protein [Candidatus Eisenbacteria bacterium]|nr:glycosyltransferase family 2 protein [Candidatus Eisenbacteria bacterium]
MISVIVPVYNDSKNLGECLSALERVARADTEIIVVNDASTDDSAAVAERFGVRVVNLPKNSGPAVARNTGARHASGDILFFVDSDVVLAPDALDRLEQAFAPRPDLAAVFGSYDACPRASGLISQYRNLLHHFVHQNGNTEASTFWAGCGAIRRGVFEAVGGFDEGRFRWPSIEDIELGYRLRRAGYPILLEKSLQATHLKRWTFGSMLRTDVVGRALPWSRLILETKSLPDDLNLRWHQRLGFLLTVTAAAGIVLSFLWPGSALLTLAALAGVLLLNRKLYLFFARQNGFLFAIACVPLHLLYYLYSGVSYLYVWTAFHLGRSAGMCVLASSVPKTKPGHREF